jgi:Flp pilus assembly secretin CpaC
MNILLTRRRVISFVSAVIAGSALVGGTAPAYAQEYVLPAEEAAKHEEQANPDTVVGIRVPAGRLEVIQIQVANLGRATVISSSPEIADIHVEDPGLLFIFGRVVGQTVVVIADENKDPVYTSKITVFLPEDQGG